MKKYIVAGICLVIVIVGILLWRKEDQTESVDLIFLTESHYILYDEDQYLDIDFYSNRQEINLMDDALTCFIHNEDESIKFMIEDILLKSIHSEQFEEKTFYGYRLKLKLPQINDSYYIDKLYVKIDNLWINESFYAGELFVKYKQNETNDFKWSGLEGIKNNSVQLKQIVIDVLSEVDIQVFIGPHELSFTYYQNQLIIQVDMYRYLMHQTYVEIITNEGSTYLPYFNYFMHYEMLKTGMFRRYTL